LGVSLNQHYFLHPHGGGTVGVGFRRSHAFGNDSGAPSQPHSVGNAASLLRYLECDLGSMPPQGAAVPMNACLSSTADVGGTRRGLGTDICQTMLMVVAENGGIWFIVVRTQSRQQSIIADEGRQLANERKCSHTK
jgi:hypothetical protein